MPDFLNFLRHIHPHSLFYREKMFENQYYRGFLKLHLAKQDYCRKKYTLWDSQVYTKLVFFAALIFPARNLIMKVNLLIFENLFSYS